MSLRLSSGELLQTQAVNWTDVTFGADSAARVQVQSESSVSDAAAAVQCATVAAGHAAPYEAFARCTALFMGGARAAAAPVDGKGDETKAAKPVQVTGNAYIQSASWNGVPLSQPFLDHAQISKGGSLQVVLGPQPNPDAFCS
jgi:hypothetical protein